MTMLFSLPLQGGNADRKSSDKRLDFLEAVGDGYAHFFFGKNFDFLLIRMSLRELY